VYGVWCMVYGVWCMVYGVWCMVYGVWCMVYGVWCMVYGVYCMVYGGRCVVYGVWRKGAAMADMHQYTIWSGRWEDLDYLRWATGVDMYYRRGWRPEGLPNVNSPFTMPEGLAASSLVCACCVCWICIHLYVTGGVGQGLLKHHPAAASAQRNVCVCESACVRVRVRVRACVCVRVRACVCV
jgi:hypothetical protein